MSTTVVTVFYELAKSKHQTDKYIEWASNFFRSVTSPTVCYTTRGFKKIFSEFVKHDNVIFDTSKQLNDWKISNEHDWEKQYELDPERYHSPDLYKAWAIKQEAVMETIRCNPFCSTTFVWCDIGCFRYDDGPTGFASIPPEIQAESGWFACLSISNTIGGGVLAGDAVGWSEFSSLYLQELNSMVQQGVFIGKDQDVYKRCNLKMKSVTTVYDAKHWGHHGDSDWFYLVFLFSARTPC